MRIDVGKAFNLGADDPEGWKKAVLYAVVILACSLGAVLILPALFMLLYAPGYAIQYTRNVATGDNQRRLPEVFSAAGLWHGFVATLVYIVYSLPLMGLLFVGVGGAAMALFSGKGSTASAMGGAGLGMVSLLTACFLGLVVMAFIPMITLQYCKNYQFGDAFNFGAIFSGMMASPADYAAVVFVPIGAGIAVGMIPLVGMVAAPLVTLVGCNLVGQYGASVLHMIEETAAEPAEVGFTKF